MDIVDYYYILNPICLNKKKKMDWIQLWINKSDYVSNYYEEIRGKYNIIDESIDYYMVMLEVGISYLKGYDNYYDYSYMQHKVIIENGYFDEKYLKEDFKERDFAEYIKYLFLKKYSIDYVYELIDRGSKKFNYRLVIARLFFPSYYFYYLERAIIDGKDYDKLCDIVNRTSLYEEYLKNVVERMNKYMYKKIILPF